MRYMLVGILLFALVALAGPQKTPDYDALAKKYGGVPAPPAYSDCLPWLIQESERTKARSSETSDMVMGWKDAEVADLKRQLREAREGRDDLSRRYEQVSRENTAMKAVPTGGSGYGYYSPPPVPYYGPYTGTPGGTRLGVTCVTTRNGPEIITSCY